MRRDVAGEIPFRRAQEQIIIAVAIPNHLSRHRTDHGHQFALLLLLLQRGHLTSPVGDRAEAARRLPGTRSLTQGMRPARRSAASQG